MDLVCVYNVNIHCAVRVVKVVRWVETGPSLLSSLVLRGKLLLLLLLVLLLWRGVFGFEFMGVFDAVVEYVVCKMNRLVN